MEPKPSRIPRRVTDQPSTSSHMSSSVLRSRLEGYSDSYRTREYSRGHELDFQEPGTLPSSSRDWTRDRYSLEPSWKATSSSYQRCSGTYDHSLSRSLGNRSRVSTSSSSPSWYEPLERAQGSYTNLHSQQQDCDSKRPKLSYSGCSSGIRSSTQGLTSTPDSTRYGRFPRTSSLMLGSSGSDTTRERRVESSTSGLTDYRHRNTDTTPSYLQDRVSSYAQGARPKETSLSTSRLNTSSLNHQLPSRQSSSFLSRNSRLGNSVESNASRRDVQSDYRQTTRRNEGNATSTRAPTVQRSTNEQPTDTDGRRTTRHLLSRLASMSSTFFSRRSSQDSSSGRTPEPEPQPCLHEAPQSNVPTSSFDIPENRASDQSQGFVFLRRRRLGMSTVSNPSSDSDAESNRSEESETRTSSASWLPSSIRNRCTPLFSRRRREGRDETARATSTSDTGRSHNPFRRSSRDEPSSDPQVNYPGAAASSSRSSTSSTATGASLVDSIFSRSNSGISGMLPNSLLHFSVPAALGNTLSENVMITVDIVPSGRTNDEPDNEKSQASSRDPEKLKKIQESLLLEDSEEEDDLCRICQTGVSTPTNPFIQPCKCSGSLQFVHQDCMKKWLEAKINSGSSLDTITTCELCKEKLELNLEDFDLQELYRSHANERAEYEFISSGLYLVVLLHLCEQRFSDMLGAANEASSRVRFISLARALQAHMEDLDTSEDDSEDERV